MISVIVLVGLIVVSVIGLLPVQAALVVGIGALPASLIVGRRLASAYIRDVLRTVGTPTGPDVSLELIHVFGDGVTQTN